MHIYGDHQSGNCYKIRLVAEILGHPYTWSHVDIVAGQSHTSEFLALNPNGKIPVVKFDDGRLLSESNAIINYLAHGSALLPTEPFTLAQVQQWQFFEQYSHEPQVAVARYIRKYLGMPTDQKDRYAACVDGSHRVLKLMDTHLAERDFFVGETPTVADVSLYAYTHVAPEGGVLLDDYTHVQAWLKRITDIPGYVPMLTAVN